MFHYLNLRRLYQHQQLESFKVVLQWFSKTILHVFVFLENRLNDANIFPLFDAHYSVQYQIVNMKSGKIFLPQVLLYSNLLA